MLVLSAAPLARAASCGADTRRCGRLSLRRCAERLGPVFVRLAQAVADQRRGPLSRELAFARAGLDPRAGRVIAEDLGYRPEEIFEIPPGREFPVYVSPLGQVYCWRLSGRDVAVKVQREGLCETLARDLLVLRSALAFTERLGLLGGKGSKDVRDFDAWAVATWAELDYQREARDQESFCGRLTTLVKGVEVPSVCWNTTRGRILTTHWVGGVRLADAPIASEAASLVARGLVSAPASSPPASLLSMALRVASSPMFSPALSVASSSSSAHVSSASSSASADAAPASAEQASSVPATSGGD